MKRELAAGLLLLMLLLGAALNIRHVDALTEELLVSLVREELSENSNWYAYQSKNRPVISL